jgi:hypothetical protein
MYGGGSVTGAGLLQVLQYPVPVIPQIATRSLSGAGAVCQIVADVPSELSDYTPRNILNCIVQF